MCGQCRKATSPSNHCCAVTLSCCHHTSITLPHCCHSVTCHTVTVPSHTVTCHTAITLSHCCIAVTLPHYHTAITLSPATLSHCHIAITLSSYCRLPHCHHTVTLRHCCHTAITLALIPASLFLYSGPDFAWQFSRTMTWSPLIPYPLSALVLAAPTLSQQGPHTLEGSLVPAVGALAPQRP